MITEARVEVHIEKISGWLPATKPNGALSEGTIPHAVEQGREHYAYFLKHYTQASPVRVVDSSGAVVAQWGRP